VHNLLIGNSFESATLTVKDKEYSESLWAFSQAKLRSRLGYTSRPRSLTNL